MTEKNQQEKMAAERQVELFTNAFKKAKENNGIWLTNDGRKAPALYQKHLQVSAFNAIVLGMHAAQNNYKTNQYTLFSEAKKRGESVQSKEKGVPFLWYNWNEYVNKHNPEDKISRADYQALPSEKQADYKGIRSREVRALFNIEQTTLPMVDKTAYEATVQEHGRLSDRNDVESASTAIRQGVENLLDKARENMVEIRSDSTGVAHYDSKTARNQADTIKSILPKHYYVADEIRNLPNKSTKEFVIVKDADGKMADVVLPEGASLGFDSDIPGMRKDRIEHALQKEGYDTVTFYNVDGSMGYRPDDSFFDGKAVSVARLNKWNLETITLLDVSDAVRRSGAVDFDKVLMLRDDNGKWALYLKAENERAFCVYPDKADVNLFFTTVKQGDEEVSDTMRQDMAQKYYMEASNKPEMKVDLFKSNVPAEEVEKIQRVNIFKTKETENQPSVILCMPTVNGEKLKPREISPSQWQRMWLAENMQDYKKYLAASLFADVLRKDRTDAVAVGTEKSEQEAQSNEVKQNTTQQEEDKTVEEQKEETPENKEQKQKEEKAKEEKTKAETKAAAVVAISPMLKQFYDLKAKHPDAVLLFRCGDFYETYCQDAEKASKILGITLTKSSRTKDADGKPLAMAGFPYHALDTYLPKLIREGERVGICDQLESPKRNKEEASPSKEEKPHQEQKNSSGMHR